MCGGADPLWFMRKCAQNLRFASLHSVLRIVAGHITAPVQWGGIRKRPRALQAPKPKWELRLESTYMLDVTNLARVHGRMLAASLFGVNFHKSLFCYFV